MKRLFDIVSSSLVLIVLFPLLLIIATLIKIESKGPILYKQKRNGRNWNVFLMYKFRSMKLHDESIYVQTKKNDSRITRIGRFLRKTSLDELPQLINIIKGEMSVVGPRPHAPAFDDKFVQIIENYEKRYNVKPGLTGLAQIKGYRGGEDIEGMKMRAKYDLEYINRNNFLIDIKIILLTLPSLLKKGIY